VTVTASLTCHSSATALPSPQYATGHREPPKTPTPSQWDVMSACERLLKSDGGHCYLTQFVKLVCTVANAAA
jgi:hypothetical protein